ncbi:MAG: AAA family ATPase [Nitrospirota bacterium]|nr:AAA family ATPase [Nitrospirota bacterium]
MSFNIAVAGKGGTGKTSISGMLIRYLLEKKSGPVLAVDADANSNLPDVLGVDAEVTIGKLREGTKHAHAGGAAGTPQQETLEMQISQALIEAKGFDLLVMGRSEGPGCYCFPNHIIRRLMHKLSENYPYVVMDNEAGLEHLSRRTSEDTDLLLIISDSSVRGLKTAKTVKDLIAELELRVGRIGLIVNRLQGELAPESKAIIESMGIPLLGTIPSDDLIFKYDTEGKPLFQLPAESVALNAAFGIFESLNIP